MDHEIELLEAQANAIDIALHNALARKLEAAGCELIKPSDDTMTFWKIPIGNTFYLVAGARTAFEIMMTLRKSNA